METERHNADLTVYDQSIQFMDDEFSTSFTTLGHILPGIQNREILLLLKLNLIHSRRIDATLAIDIVATDYLWLNNTETVMMDPPLLFEDPLSTPTSHTVALHRQKITKVGGKTT